MTFLRRIKARKHEPAYLRQNPAGSTTAFLWVYIAIGSGLLTATILFVLIFLPNGYWKSYAFIALIVMLLLLFFNPHYRLLMIGTACALTGASGIVGSFQLDLSATLPSVGPISASFRTNAAVPPGYFILLTILGLFAVIIDSYLRGWYPLYPKTTNSPSPPISLATSLIRLSIDHEVASASFYIPDTEHLKDLLTKPALLTLSMHCTYEFACSALHTPIDEFSIQFQRNQNSALEWSRGDGAYIEQTFKSARAIPNHDHIHILEASESVQKVRIVFDPPLLPATSPTLLSFERMQRQSQLLTFEDLRTAITQNIYSANMPFCSQGRTIFYPTRHLTIESRFPSWYEIWHPRARVTRNGVEIPEIQKDLTIQRRSDVSQGLRLDVPENRIHLGCVYAIVWQPPTRAELLSKLPIHNE